MLDQGKISELLASRAVGSNSHSKSNSRLKRIRLWLPIIVLGASLAFLIYQGLGNSLVYFHTVDEALALRPSLGTTTFRLEGVVVAGSVHSNTFGGVDFYVSGTDGKRIFVQDSANPPELFQPNLPVVLVGYFSGLTFKSDQIMVKHSANYIAAYPNRVSSLHGKKL